MQGRCGPRQNRDATAIRRLEVMRVTIDVRGCVGAWVGGECAPVCVFIVVGASTLEGVRGCARIRGGSGHCA